MTRRLGLIGAECTGKTTLARALAEELPGCRADEQLRHFVERLGRPPRADEQRQAMASQMHHEEQVAQHCVAGVVIADPAPLMTAVYSLAYFDDRTLLDDAIEHARGYSLLVWCDLDLPWEADPGQRDGPEHRARVHELLDTLVTERLEPGGFPLVRASGSPSARIEAVTRAWQTRPPIAPT